MSECVICQSTTDGTRNVCDKCATRFLNRLAWLDRIGMPTLRDIAYRRIRLTDASARSTAASPSPINQTAAAMYRDVERFLQHVGGRIGLPPIGHDHDEQPVSVHDWEWLIPHIVGWHDRIWKLHDIDDIDATLATLCVRIARMSTPVEERRLIGVCTQCLPDRTPILAASSDRYAVCPACHAFLTLSNVRRDYLAAAGMMHITRTQQDAARWVSQTTGVHVTGKDLMNARQQGRIHPRHIEGRYWEWDLDDLLTVATSKHRRNR